MGIIDAYLIRSLTSEWQDLQTIHVLINMQWNEGDDTVTSLKTERNWTLNVRWILLRSQIVQLITAVFQNRFFFLPEEAQKIRKFE